MSSSAERLWITSGSRVSRAAAICRRRADRLRFARRVVVEIIEPGLADRDDLADALARRTRSAVSISSSSSALCGCVPTEQKTSDSFSAIARIVLELLHARRDRDHLADAGRDARARRSRRARPRSPGNPDGSGCRSACRVLMLPARHSAGTPASALPAPFPQPDVRLRRATRNRACRPERPRDRAACPPIPA